MASLHEIKILAAMIQLLLLTHLIQSESLREAKDVKKFVQASKTPTSISHSLVNFGKIDIAFFVSPDGKEFIGNLPPRHHSSDILSSIKRLRSDSHKPCPCASLTSNSQFPTSSPSDLLSNILMNNELFSFREPTISTSCCEDHHDQMPLENDNTNPFNFKSIVKKPNVIDIVFFKNKPDINFDDLFRDAFKSIEKLPIKKELLHLVGDKNKSDNVNEFLIKPPLANFEEDLNTVKIMADNKLESNKSNQVDDADKVVTKSNKNLF